MAINHVFPISEFLAAYVILTYHLKGEVNYYKANRLSEGILYQKVSNPKLVGCCDSGWAETMMTRRVHVVMCFLSDLVLYLGCRLSSSLIRWVLQKVEQSIRDCLEIYATSSSTAFSKDPVFFSM